MGLFSTLTSATTSSDGQANLRKSPQSSTSSSANIPTLVQLYAGDVSTSSSSSSNNGAILMENNPLVTGYTTLTYQAVQVGEQASRDDAMKNHQHMNPDLGVWNCRVQQKEKRSIPLIDSLLAKVAPQTSVYCLTVDLSDETSVETNLSSLQAALVRHLIEHPPSSSATTKTDTATTETDGEMDIDPATTSSTSSGNNIETTSLYDLQTAQFGLASEEKAAEQTIEETAKDVKIGLMICAVVGSSSSSRGGGGDDDTNQNNLAADISSESAYKKKQARALVVYHLRKFANAINAALCFVDRPAAVENHQSSEGDNKPQTTEVAAAADDTTTTNAAEDTQIAIPYDKLSQLWRDMAMGIPVWEQQSTETEDTAAATALYGPGRQQEDLIESLLLRNANYPGHWDANKDSLWVALPSTSGGGGTSEMSTQTITTGDGGWLTQLRDSIASALPATEKTSGNEKASADDDGKPKEKDAAVSSFFESLLANP